MPGLHIYKSNRLETLSEALAEVTGAPLRSVLQVRQGRIMVRNETVFEQYRKFEASSEIKYDY